MTAIVVLGMHRSGTSLVASMLEAMGVHMGDRLMEPSVHNPHGYFEDLDFYNLNQLILHDAGGDWSNPPSAKAIRAAGERLRYRIEGLIAQKTTSDLWGWKDPRTCLTAGLYHPHLDDVKYVVVRRDRRAAVDSLMRREGGYWGDWGELYNLYSQRAVQFLTDIDAPIHHIRYEDAVHPKTGMKEARKLAQFVGKKPGNAATEAEGRIEYQDSWGFGSVGYGVPKFKEVDEFWLAWSWFLVGGVEETDRFLNRSGKETKMPLITWLPRMHNAIIRMFLQSGCDTLLLIEDDHYFPFDQLRKMRHKPENQKFDIVCASYVRRTSQDIPLPMGWNIAENTDDPYRCWFSLNEIKYEGTQEYDGAAFGFTLIRRWVLEAMIEGENLEQYEWAKCAGEITPDVPFYYRAVALGARTGVDRDNWIGHVGTRNYTPADFKEWDEKRIEYLKAQEGVTNG